MKPRHIIITAILVLAIAVGGVVVVKNWFRPLTLIESCVSIDRRSEYKIVEAGPRFTATAGYMECVREKGKQFIDRDYAESKDITKTFFTLIAAVLVASITFSEKIVDVAAASFLPLSMMVLCWFLLLMAIVTCGTGLALMSTAAGFAEYEPWLSYRVYEAQSITLFLIAGVSFASALLALILAGITSFVQKRRRERVDRAARHEPTVAGTVVPSHDGQ